MSGESTGEPTHPPTLAGGEPFQLGDVVYVGQERRETSDAEHELVWREFRVCGESRVTRDWFLRRKDSIVEVAVSALAAEPRKRPLGTTRFRRFRSCR